ncbi:hypothetical protein K4G22_10425 [Streptomyces profundus]|nr:hypothetical protein K4G22_10425 [Streptomyces sp. MA3_2.13]
MRRHRFEPARLVLGLCLLPISVLYILQAVDQLDIPVVLRFTMLPGALVLAGLVAVANITIRKAVAAKRPAVAGGSTDGDTMA